MATVPRAWIDGYADSLEMISDEMRRRLAEALERVDYTMPVAYVRERLIAIMQSHVYESRAMASQMAAEFYDGLRERQVGERMGAVAYDGYDPVRVERRVRSAVQPLAEAQEEFRWADDVRYDEEYQREMTRVAARRLCRDLADYQGYSIKEAAGSTVFRNGGRDGRRVRFARIPRGSKSYPNGCPFCQMLASRGFKYRSELVAGGLDPDHYHSDCQCMVVPSWGKGSVEGYDPHDYDEGYQAYLDQDHSEHDQHVRETQRNRYDAWGRLKSGDGSRVDEKGALTDEDRARIRSKRTAAGNETRKADRSRMFRGLGVTEDEWKAMSEAEQAALLGSERYAAGIPDDLIERYGRISGTHSRNYDLISCNPGWSSGKLEYMVNCQRCCVAYEARRRGLDVIAAPHPMPNHPELEYLTMNPHRAFRRREQISAGTDDGKAGVMDAVMVAGDGARFEVFVQWESIAGPLQSPSLGHVFVAENHGGNIRFVDPQTRRENVSSYFRRAKSGYTTYWRIDDAEFSVAVDQYVRKAGEVDGQS